MTQRPGKPKVNPSHRSEIGKELWPELRRMELEGKSLKEIADWLKSEHGIRVSNPTVSRRLAAIRPADPAAAEDDTLEAYRERFHRHATSDAVSVQAQISAARLVIAVMAEQRARRVPAPSPPLPGAPAAAVPAAIQMTPEEEAEAARAYLGKAN